MSQNPTDPRPLVAAKLIRAELERGVWGDLSEAHEGAVVLPNVGRIEAIINEALAVEPPPVAREPWGWVNRERWEAYCLSSRGVDALLVTVQPMRPDDVPLFATPSAAGGVTGPRERGSHYQWDEESRDFIRTKPPTVERAAGAEQPRTVERNQKATLRAMEDLLADDAYAISFQTMGQYRTAIRTRLRALLAALRTAAPTREHVEALRERRDFDDYAVGYSSAIDDVLALFGQEPA
jgi:hypothetical protein